MDENPFLLSLQLNEAVLERKMLVKKFRHIEFMD